MTKLRSLPLFVSLCLLPGVCLVPTASQGQGVAPRVRITSRIDETDRVTLGGNTHPAANAKNDQGKVADSLPMTDLILVLSRDSAQQAAFDAYVASEYDQNSPNFHQWLTPDQVGEQFGPSQTDIQTIVNWLTGHGFTVAQVTKDGMSIRFSGTAGQVQSAFHTEIHNLVVKGQAHIGNMSDPQIPASLSTVVVGVKSLHNFFPRPAHHLGSTVQLNAQGQWMRSGSGESTGDTSSSPLADPPFPTRTLSRRPTPQLGANGPSNGGSYQVEDVGPWDFATIYNLTKLWSAGIDGAGQTIAIAGTSAIDVGEPNGSGASGSGTAVNANGNNDVATFRTFFNLPTNSSYNTPILLNGSPSSQPLTVCTSLSATALCNINDLLENSLDVEWAASIAKNAQIVLVSSYPQSASDDNLYDSESYIVDNLTAHIMNVSYSECELGLGTAGNVQYYDLWQTAAAEGIAVFVAAGDSGSAGCDTNAGRAENGLAVSGMASTPWNTAVGGTDFNWCPPQDIFTYTTTPPVGCTATPYWNTSNAANQSSAVGYVPEVPWNDSCANPLAFNWINDIALKVYEFNSGDLKNNDTEQACNFMQQEIFEVGGDLSYYYPYGVKLLSVVGGGGGPSGCVSNTTSSAITNHTLGTCNTGATSTGATTNPATGASQLSVNLVNNGWPKPSWQTGVTGIPTDGVRDLPDVSFFASDGYLSSSAYLICVSQDASAYGTAQACNYSSNVEPIAQEVGGTSVATPAMAGVMALINQKTGASQGNPNAELYSLAAKQSSSGYSACSAESVTAASTGCYFNDIDQSNTDQPCDALNNTPNCASHEMTAGEQDFIGILPGYNATTGYDLATGLGSLNIFNVVEGWTPSNGSAAVNVTVTPTPSSIPSNNSLSVTVTVASVVSGGQTPTGTVTLFGGGYGPTAAQTLDSSGAYTFLIPASSFSVGVSTLTVGYSGDPVYSLATGQNSVTVTSPAPLTPTVTVMPASSTITANNSLNVTVSVTGTGAAPTGTITLSASSGSYTAATETIAIAPCTSNTACVFTIPANSLGVGGVTLTANYSGDTNYASVHNSGSVTVTSATPTITVMPASSTIVANTSLNVTVSVTGTGATPTGTITLSASSGSYTATLETIGTSPCTSNTACVFTIPANSLGTGSVTLTANYGGDTNYTLGQSTGSVTVTPAPLTPTVTVTPASSSIVANTSLNVTVSVTGGGATPTGNITLSASSGSYTATLETIAIAPCTSNTACVFTIPANSLGTGSVTLTAKYGGDTNYALAQSTGSVTVTAAPPTITVMPASSSIVANTSLNVTVSVTGTGAAPTGTITLTASSGSYTATLETIGTSPCTSNTACVFTIPANSLGVGGVTLTANYSGDTNYTLGQSTGSVTVTAAPLTPTVTVMPASSSIVANTSLNVTVSVTGTGAAPTGTITLSASSGSYSATLETIGTSPCTSNTACVFTIPANALSTGSVTLTAKYSGDTNYTLAQSTGSVTVTAAPPTITVMPASSSIVANTSLNVTVSVTGGGATPTGTITLSASSGSYTATLETIGTSPCTSNTACVFTIPANALSTGSVTLTAKYSGDTNYTLAQSTGSVTVTAAPPTITVMPASSSIVANTSLNVTVSVTGGGATPTGTITLSASSGSYTATLETIGTSPCASNTACVFTIPANALSTGSVTLTAKYSGDTNYTLAQNTGSVTVTAAPPTIAVMPASSSIVANTSLNVTVSVTGGGATPTGTITLSASSGSYTATLETIGTSPCASNTACVFTIPANALSTGSVTLTAKYSGDTNYTLAQSTGSVTVTAAPPTITVMPASSSIVANTSLNVTVSVTGGGATPTGTITLSASSGSYTATLETIGTSPCASNTACVFTIPANALSTGSVTLTAKYSGDTNYTLGQSTGSVTVTAAPPTITVMPASSSIVANTSLNVTVSVTGGGSTPTGTITLSASSGTYTATLETIGTSPCASNTACVFTIPANALSTGSVTLTAKYSGDTNYTLAQSTGSVTVTAAPPTITVMPASSSIVANTSLNVTVSVTGGGSTPTGTITLSASSGTYTATLETIGTSPCTSNTACVFTIPANALSTGSVTLTAKYSGDTNYTLAQNTGSVTVTPAPLTPTITVTPASSSVNANASLNVTVSVTGGGSTPTGTITLSASSGSYTATLETIGTSPCASNTACVFTIPANALSTGSVTLTANYGGDTNYTSGQNTGSVTVTSTFTLAAGTASPSSVAPGSSATVVVTGTAVAGYTGAVTLSCAEASGDPSSSYPDDTPTCTGSNNGQINFATCGSSCTVTFTVGTTVTHTVAQNRRPNLPGGNGREWLGAGSGAILALLVFFGIPARRRSWRSMLSLLVVMIAIGGLASCGGSGGGGGGGGGYTDSGTTAGTYVFTVTSTANPSVTPTVTATFSVTVN